jgi:hypothetical protein
MSECFEKDHNSRTPALICNIVASYCEYCHVGDIIFLSIHFGSM